MCVPQLPRRLVSCLYLSVSFCLSVYMSFSRVIIHQFSPCLLFLCGHCPVYQFCLLVFLLPVCLSLYNSLYVASICSSISSLIHRFSRCVVLRRRGRWRVPRRLPGAADVQDVPGAGGGLRQPVGPHPCAGAHGLLCGGRHARL